MPRKPIEEWTSEELVSYLFTAWVSPHIEITYRGTHKHDAVERYMRTYLRALTLGELRNEVEYTDEHNQLSAWLTYKAEKASQGYDAFMAKRSKVTA